jgi:hypothetical protein
MEDCSVRHLISDKWTNVLGPDASDTVQFMRQHASEIPKDFLFDLLVTTEAKLSAQGADAQGPLANKCKFHKHVDDSDRCTRMTLVHKGGQIGKTCHAKSVSRPRTDLMILPVYGLDDIKTI